jgi:hypothetical protein
MVISSARGGKGDFLCAAALVGAYLSGLIPCFQKCMYSACRGLVGAPR